MRVIHCQRAYGSREWVRLTRIRAAGRKVLDLLSVRSDLTESARLTSWNCAAPKRRNGREWGAESP
jgi:hypothetical protein